MTNNDNPNTPTQAEAASDNHQDAQQRGRCQPTDPCIDCRQALAQRR